MRDFIDMVVAPLILAAILITCITLAIYTGSQAWRCNSWSKMSNDKTMMAAGTCYVYKDNQWKELDLYIRFNSL